MNPVMKELWSLRDDDKAKLLSRFFKTGVGEYGEGDVFLGISVPNQRKITSKHKKADMTIINELLLSKYHEARLTALLILVLQYEKGDNNAKKEIFDYYVKMRHRINNWDLVDVTCHKIIGDYVLSHPEHEKLLYKMARSDNLWDKRIAMISCFAHIRNESYELPIGIATILLYDEHDLIHKAVGWMLREIGKKDVKVLLKFLDNNAHVMPRTMLRYSIERLDRKEKDYYMAAKTNIKGVKE